MLLMAPDVVGWPQPRKGATLRTLDTIQLNMYLSSDLRYQVESQMPGCTAHTAQHMTQQPVMRRGGCRRRSQHKQLYDKLVVGGTAATEPQQ
jgi:hypothetical protein